MVKYTIQRLLLAVITTFIILTATYFLMKMLPFPKAVGLETQRLAYYLDQSTKGFVIDSPVPLSGYEFLESFRNSASGDHYFYVRPAWQQYLNWVSGVLTRGDWGTSSAIMLNVDAMRIIALRLPLTIQINIWSVIISVPAGLGLGIWAALKKNTMTDHIISTLVMVFISIPSFIIITFLMKWLAYDTGWLPSQWSVARGAPFSVVARSYVIPVMALSFGSICGYTRFTRAELTEVMSSDYLLLARTKGLTKNQTIVRHALRNAMVPIIPSILAEVIGLLSGSMVLESLYGIQGIGQLYINAVNSNDYNVLMADMAFYTIIGLVAGVFLDLSYGFIDPRIRMGAKK